MKRINPSADDDQYKDIQNAQPGICYHLPTKVYGNILHTTVEPYDLSQQPSICIGAHHSETVVSLHSSPVSIGHMAISHSSSKPILEAGTLYALCSRVAMIPITENRTEHYEIGSEVASSPGPNNAEITWLMQRQMAYYRANERPSIQFSYDRPQLDARRNDINVGDGRYEGAPGRVDPLSDDGLHEDWLLPGNDDNITDGQMVSLHLEDNNEETNGVHISSE